MAISGSARGMLGLRFFRLVDDGTLELFEFRKGMEQLGVVASEGDLLSLFRRVANERDGFIRYEDFIKIFAPQVNTAPALKFGAALWHSASRLLLSATVAGCDGLDGGLARDSAEQPRLSARE